MKLAAKLTATVTFIMCLVLAGYGYFSLKRQFELFQEDMAHDGLLLGQTIAQILDTEAGHSRSADELVKRLSKSISDFSFDWTPADSEHEGGDRLLLRHAADSPSPIELSLTIGGKKGTLKIVPSPEKGDVYVAKTVENLSVVLLLMTALGAMLSFALGHHLVGKPVSLLIEKARSVGAGENIDLQAGRQDELSELAREMNTMSEKIVTAKSIAQEKEELRRLAEKKLRDAERLATVGQLAAGLAHEMGTPLNVVAGYAELLSTGPAREQIDVTQAAEIILDQAKRMTAIVRQMLDFARRTPASKQANDLGKAAQETIRLLNPLAEKRGVALLYHPKNEENYPATFDYGQLQQVISNIVINAIQAMSDGGVVNLEIDDISINTRSYYRLSIADEGPGISPEHLTKLFDPFFTTKEVGQGTGLGLSVAHGIVQEHGGKIEVESKLGSGTKFNIYIPHSGTTPNETTPRELEGV